MNAILPIIATAMYGAWKAGMTEEERIEVAQWTFEGTWAGRGTAFDGAA